MPDGERRCRCPGAEGERTKPRSLPLASEALPPARREKVRAWTRCGESWRSSVKRELSQAWAQVQGSGLGLPAQGFRLMLWLRLGFGLAPAGPLDRPTHPTQPSQLNQSRAVERRPTRAAHSQRRRRSHRALGASARRDARSPWDRQVTVRWRHDWVRRGRGNRNRSGSSRRRARRVDCHIWEVGSFGCQVRMGGQRRVASSRAARSEGSLLRACASTARCI